MAENYKLEKIPQFFIYFAYLVLTALFLVVTMLQVFSFPGQFRYEANSNQGSQVIRWALTIAVGLWFLLAQVAIVSLWKILRLIFVNDLISERGLSAVNLLVRTLATAMAYGGLFTLVAASTVDDPGPVVVLTALTMFVAAIYFVSYFVRHQMFRGSALI